MNKISKAIITAVVTILVLACLTGCGAQSNVITQPLPDAGATITEVTGKCTVEKTGDRTFKVHCTTNLMNGTVIAICVDTYAGENIDTQKFVKNSNSFYTEFEIPDDVTGPLIASLVVVPSENGKQPVEVREAYGAQLQNLSGEFVIWNTVGNCVVILSEPFEV